MLNIIIPVYNSLETLPSTLNSLVNQTKRMFVITIIDDGGDVDYSDIITEYRHRGLTIRFLRLPENSGPGVARQFGIESSLDFEHIMFLDSDDILLPYAVEVLHREIQIKNADVVMSDLIFQQKDQHYYSVVKSNDCWAWLLGKIYRLDYLRKNKISFHPNLFINEDTYFQIVSLNSTKNKYKVDMPTAIRTDSPTSLTNFNETNLKENNIHSRYGDHCFNSYFFALNKLNELNSIDNVNLVSIIKDIYNFHMVCLYYNISVNEDNFSIFKTNTKLQQIISKTKIYKKILDVLPAYVEDYGNYIYPSISFKEWYNKYIMEEEI